MNTEQGSSHSVISSTNTVRCQQTCPHMSSLFFSTQKGTINEPLCTPRLQTQTSHQNVMLNIIHEKYSITMVGLWGFHLLEETGFTDANICYNTTCIPGWQAFHITTKITHGSSITLTEIQVMCPQSHFQLPEQWTRISPPPTTTHTCCSFSVGNIFLTNGPPIISCKYVTKTLNFQWSWCNTHSKVRVWTKHTYFQLWSIDIL
jgi:hypothetical protein